MAQLSGHGVKMVLPKIMKGMTDDVRPTHCPESYTQPESQQAPQADVSMLTWTLVFDLILTPNPAGVAHKEGEHPDAGRHGLLFATATGLVPTSDHPVPGRRVH